VISVSTTPYNHPILPLLLDMNNAQKANPHTPLPGDPLRLKEDAVKQVQQAIDLYVENFGCQPKGFWPAEGAVDEESVGIYKSMGINWIATDEAILFKSMKDENRAHLYNAYDFNGVSMGFRDHGLSDLIGFNYRFKPQKDAVEHFMGSLKHINNEQDDATVFVILDGENAWEFYPDNAYGFFTGLYQALAESEWCQSVTMDEVASKKDKPKLPRLAPGSWIHGDFNTWSGHSEKNRAWELIYQTKRDVSEALQKADEALAKQVEHHFLAAECSDWFWWYGDDHVTEFGVEFDALFREHLITIYTLLECTPPHNLFEPILQHHEQEPVMQPPSALVYPVKDARQGAFFSWVGSGVIDERKMFSTMDRVRGPIEVIKYGFNESCIELAFCGDVDVLKGHELLLSIEECKKPMLLALQNHHTDTLSVRIGQCIEVSFLKSLFEGEKAIHLRCELRDGDTIIQTLPGFGTLEIQLDDDFTTHWFV
jgi:alpha-amylase/alpha-mannosidase (GH57 family)